jgi:hypothetical protein
MGNLAARGVGTGAPECWSCGVVLGKRFCAITPGLHCFITPLVARIIWLAATISHALNLFPLYSGSRSPGQNATTPIPAKTQVAKTTTNRLRRPRPLIVFPSSNRKSKFEIQKCVTPFVNTSGAIFSNASTAAF